MNILQIIKYLLPTLLLIVAAGIFVATFFWCRNTLRMQHKLKYSITLVALKVWWLPYLICDIFFAMLAFLVFGEMLSPNQLIVNIFVEKIGLTTGIYQICATCVFAILISVTAVFTVLTFCKCAVVDSGIYTGTSFLDWYHLYDYYVDEKENFVILSNSKNGALTLAGTTIPLKFNRNDIDKLKFILNKNKNKFVPLQELR